MEVTDGEWRVPWYMDGESPDKENKIKVRAQASQNKQYGG